jgi:hypothetical protein
MQTAPLLLFAKPTLEPGTNLAASATQQDGAGAIFATLARDFGVESATDEVPSTDETDREWATQAQPLLLAHPALLPETPFIHVSWQGDASVGAAEDAGDRTAARYSPIGFEAVTFADANEFSPPLQASQTAAVAPAPLVEAASEEFQDDELASNRAFAEPPSAKASATIDGVDKPSAFGEAPIQSPAVAEQNSVAPEKADTASLPIASQKISTPSASTPPVLQNAAFTVVEVQRISPKTIEIRLDPPDLGPISIEIVREPNGDIRAIVTAERSETLTLARRHVETLARELSNIGEQQPQIEFRDDGAPRRDDAERRPQKHHYGTPEREAGAAFNTVLATLNGGVDIIA